MFWICAITLCFYIHTNSLILSIQKCSLHIVMKLCLTNNRTTTVLALILVCSVLNITSDDLTCQCQRKPNEDSYEIKCCFIKLTGIWRHNMQISLPLLNFFLSSIWGSFLEYALFPLFKKNSQPSPVSVRIMIILCKIYVQCRKKCAPVQSKVRSNGLEAGVLDGCVVQLTFLWETRVHVPS